MIKQKDTKEYSEVTLPIVSQLNNFFSEWEKETEEFNKIWDDHFLNILYTYHIYYEVISYLSHQNENL